MPGRAWLGEGARLVGQWSCDRAGTSSRARTRASHPPPDLSGLGECGVGRVGLDSFSLSPQFFSHGSLPIQLGLSFCLGVSPGTRPRGGPVVPCRTEGTQRLGDMRGLAPPVSGRFPHCSQPSLVLSQ